MGALILHYKMRAAGCQRYKNDRPEGIMNSEKIYFFPFHLDPVHYFHSFFFMVIRNGSSKTTAIIAMNCRKKYMRFSRPCS